MILPCHSTVLCYTDSTNRNLDLGFFAMMNMNSGYVGWSMSERAYDAYCDGEKPKSQWTKADMLEALQHVAGELNVVLPDNIAKLRKETIFDRMFWCSSWHHTSIYCNITDFYSVDEESVKSLTAEQVDRWLAEEAAGDSRSANTREAESRFVKISFTEWIGKGNHKNPKEQFGWGELVGDWCHLIAPSANGAKKKNVYANSCKVVGKFQSKKQMLDDKACTMVSEFDGECVDVEIRGEMVKAFAHGSWLYIVDTDGDVSKKKACYSNRLGRIERIRIGDLRKEKSVQSEVLLGLRDKHRAR